MDTCAIGWSPARLTFVSICMLGSNQAVARVVVESIRTCGGQEQ